MQKTGQIRKVSGPHGRLGRIEDDGAYAWFSVINPALAKPAVITVTPDESRGRMSPIRTPRP